MRENENGRANDLVMFKSTKIFSAQCWFSPYLSCFLFPTLLEFSASNQAGQGYEDYQMQQLLPQTELIARQNALWINFCQGQRDSQFWEQKCPVEKKKGRVSNSSGIHTSKDPPLFQSQTNTIYLTVVQVLPNSESYQQLFPDNWCLGLGFWYAVSFPLDMAFSCVISEFVS